MLLLLIRCPNGTHGWVTCCNYCFYLAYVTLASNLKLMLTFELNPQRADGEELEQKLVSLLY